MKDASGPKPRGGRRGLLTRRDLIRQAGLGTAGAVLAGGTAFAATVPRLAAAEAPTSSDAGGLNRFPRMVHEYFVARVRESERRGEERRAALRTRADAEAYVRDVREKIQQSFGPWPARSPLNPRITGVLERDGYAIEKLIFESRPGFLVTANVYVPRGRSGRLPGVVCACGHYPEAKAAESYQSFAQALARFGYVSLIFDPVGQGERLLYLDEHMKSRIGNGVDEHLTAGNQQVLVGENFPAWRAWDGIRALDYLLTRPEVDPARIGVTGNSGGGTDTTWLCGVESRWAMAAPECFVTTFRRNLENELPGDTEQCPLGALALGLDHADFVAAMAPKPVILIGQEKDFFDARGLEEAYSRLKHLYRLLGAEENIALAIESDYHAYSKPSREDMYRWFNRVTGAAPDGKEPVLRIEKAEDLRCTPGGQVVPMGSRTIVSFTAEKSRRLAKSRGAPGGRDLRSAVERILRMPPVEGAPYYRILRPLKGRPYLDKYAGTYVLETEPGVMVIANRLADASLVSRPPRGAGRALLYVCDRSSDLELRSESWLAELIRAQPDPVFTCDPRGIGESRPGTCGKDYDRLYGSDYMYAAHALMLDTPYVGLKTFDVLRTIEWLRAIGHTEVHLVASGWGAPPATFAAVLSDAVVQVTLHNAPTSYADIAEAEDYGWPLSIFPPGVLASFDLPDCYAELKSKNLSLATCGPLSPTGPQPG